MARPTAPVPPRAECQPRTTLLEHQHRRLGTFLSAVHGRNRFYTRKLDDAGVQLDTLRLPDDLQILPLTTKAELAADQDASPPWGTAHTEPLDHYTRYSQTSSTTGRPPV